MRLRLSILILGLAIGFVAKWLFPPQTETPADKNTTAVAPQTAAPAQP
jgi:uncharacterized membrane protein SpoIIM required for sporulation